MNRMSQRGPHRGLTLVEVLLVVALLSVLLLVAVPGFQAVQQRLAIRAEAGRLFMALNLARSEAVSRNQPVTLCPSDYARSGVVRCGGDYRRGWVLLRAWAPMSPTLHLLDRAGARHVVAPISFMPDGTAGRNRTLMVCSHRLPDLASWSVIMNVVGRARLLRAWGECPREAVV
jgi:type IV fimbrial biogenesis protein FimT